MKLTLKAMSTSGQMIFKRFRASDLQPPALAAIKTVVIGDNAAEIPANTAVATAPTVFNKLGCSFKYSAIFANLSNTT